MHRTLAILSSLAAVVTAIGAMGCSSSSPPAGGSSSSSGGGSSGSCDLTTPVSFKTDVIPVFQMGCTLSQSCHGQMNNAAEEDLYLGENVGATDASTVYSMLVGVSSKEDPSMPLVTMGSTANSYLWHKVFADQATLASQCAKASMLCTDCTADAPCGGLMPYNGEPLATDAPQWLCTIQGWITQGAQNN